MDVLSTFDILFFHSQETPEFTEFASNLSVADRLGQISDLVPLVEFLASPGWQWISRPNHLD